MLALDLAFLVGVLLGPLILSHLLERVWGVPPAPSSPCRRSQQSFTLLPLVQLQVLRFTAGRALFSCFVFVGLKRQGLNLEPRACVRAKSPGAEVQLQPFE